MIVEVEWCIKGSTTVRQVESQDRAVEVVTELLQSFDLPNTVTQDTKFDDPNVISAYQVHFFPGRCKVCEQVTVHDEDVDAWFHKRDWSPVCAGGGFS